MPEWQDDPGRQDYNEELLLREAKSGDAQAFGRIYAVHAASVFRYLFSHVDDLLDAEDLTEEVFLRAWKSLAGFRERGLPFRAYLFRVAHNALVDYYRRAQRLHWTSNIEEDHIQEKLSDPSQTLQAHLERREIRRLLGSLRKDYRTVLDLRFLAGLSTQETAQVMGRSAGAVRVLQHRALEALRKLLKLDED